MLSETPALLKNKIDAGAHLAKAHSAFHRHVILGTILLCYGLLYQESNTL